MTAIAAFVGHSFLPEDEALVRRFLDYFDDLKDLGIDFSWEHAEAAEPKVLSDKVREKMADKNLFIGICTRREYAIGLNSATKLPLVNRYVLHQDATRVKTSDWILQEIGLAIGRDMSLMLLVEKGIPSVGGLQGDIEYIEFSRSSPEQSFRKILQMIRILRPKESPAAVEPPAERTTSTQDSDTDTDQEGTEDTFFRVDPTWSLQQYEHRLVAAIQQGDSNRESEIREAFEASELADMEANVVEFEASRMFYSHVFQKANVLAELTTLRDDHPDHPVAHEYLAAVRRGYDDRKHSAESELVCADLSADPNRQLRCLFRAAEDLIAIDEIEAARTLVERAKEVAASSPDCVAVYLDNRSNIAKALGNTNEFLAFGELALQENPADNNLRFRLAYAYSDIKLNSLSYYHYGVLARRGSDPASLNNLAVEAKALKMNGKSVAAFKRATEVENARSFGNLAHVYLDIGFFDEASDLCQRGTQIDSTDSRIAAAISRLDELRDEEKTKSEDAKEKADSLRGFYSEFGSAIDAEPLGSPPTGAWLIDDEEVVVSIDGTKFEATGNYEKDAKQGLGNALAGIRAIATKETVTVEVLGDMTGRAIEANYIQTTSGPSVGLLGSIPRKRRLLLILSDDAIQMLDLETGGGKVTNWTQPL